MKRYFKESLDLQIGKLRDDLEKKLKHDLNDSDRRIKGGLDEYVKEKLRKGFQMFESECSATFQKIEGDLQAAFIKGHEEQVRVVDACMCVFGSRFCRILVTPSAAAKAARRHPCRCLLHSDVLVSGALSARCAH